jgi:alpha-L-fucosidase
VRTDSDLSVPEPMDVERFRELGFGLFLHWGHAATRGWEMSWQMTGGVAGQHPRLEAVGCDEYFANAATFNPTRFDAQGWASTARAAGARYAVFTAKHHDGFALFDTALSDYSSVRWTDFGRDVVREYVDAFRAEGLRVGLYFSLVDWHHPDYPRYTDDTVEKPYVVGRYPRSTPQAWERFRTFMLGQLRELLSNYGQIDILWLDGEFEHTPDEWNFGEIRQFVRELQPACLVNDRCVGYGDFVTPEQQVPENPPEGAWETCLTMNDSWGWVPEDRAWKSPAVLLRELIDCVSSGGNLLLNVGPRGDGTFPAEAVERLSILGTWMRDHAESVHGVRPGLTPWQFRLPSTRRTTRDGERIYLFLTMRAEDSLLLRNLPVRRVKAVTVLATGEALGWSGVPSLPEVHRGATDPLGDVVITLPPSLGDPLCPVLAVDISLTYAQSAGAGADRADNSDSPAVSGLGARPAQP